MPIFYPESGSLVPSSSLESGVNPVAPPSSIHGAVVVSLTRKELIELRKVTATTITVRRTSCATLGCAPTCLCTPCSECVTRRKMCPICGCSGGCSCGAQCGQCDITLRRLLAGLRGCSSGQHPGGCSCPLRDGTVVPSPRYLAAAAVPSRSESATTPLVVISIEGVLCASLPPHLSGGHTNVLSRTYLDTLMDYLLHPGVDYSIAFWTGSMSRKQALEVLRMLKLPTGSAEVDERDGVVGVWSREDTISDGEGGDIRVKDLEILWRALYQEEGVRWSQENTVVISHCPLALRAQPRNLLLVPNFTYRSTVPAFEDQTLLILVQLLEELKGQTNWSYFLPAEKLDNKELWIGSGKAQEQNRNELIAQAIQLCAKLRIVIKATGGN